MLTVKNAKIRNAYTGSFFFYFIFAGLSEFASENP